MISNASLKVK